MSEPLIRQPADHEMLSPHEASPTPAKAGELLLLEEALQVGKRQVITGTVRISTTTETHQELAEVSLDRSVVEVTRVPIGKLVEAAPPVRTENETTIVPVMEERFVVVKQLFLKEELHIRHQVERELKQTTVALRRQVATVERVDASARTASDDTDRHQSINRADDAPVLESE